MAEILVTGATGKIGSAVVIALLEAEMPFKVMVRSKEKAKSFEEQDIPVVIGDYRQPATLEKALKGVERALLITPPHEKMAEWEKNFIDAAEENSVRHIVKISAIGAGPDQGTRLGRYHAAVEDYLKKADLKYTILRPHSFMQNQLGNLQTIKEQGAIYAPMGNGRIPMIDARDIGEAAAQILQGPEDYEGKIFNLTGGEALSYHDVAHIISEAVGKPVHYVNVNPEAAVSAMVGMGFPQWLAEDLVKMSEIWSQGTDTEIDNSTQAILGRQPRHFRDFVRDHEAFFKEEE